jgi:hypothetical protein
MTHFGHFGTLLVPGMQKEALWVVSEPISCMTEQLTLTPAVDRT